MKDVAVSESVVTPMAAAHQDEMLQQSDVAADKTGAEIFFQAKLTVGSPNDPLEDEADAMADQVMRMPKSPFIQRKCSHCEEEEKAQRKPLVAGITTGIQAKAENNSTVSNQVSDAIESSRGAGSKMDTETNSFMSSRFGSDFSDVNIHTDNKSVQLSNNLSAKAFTVGNDIYFNQGEYQPQSDKGKHLLAHELTHTLQQGKDSSIKSKRLVQRTTVGAILDEFFSPFSSATQWDMPEGDNYTTIVRGWQPVIDGLNSIKSNISSDCAAWAASHRTDSSWHAGMTKPPVTDPNAYPLWVSSPPGTDPETCRNAFILYQSSRLVGPSVQSMDLYTCSIGSFGLYVTVDSINCTSHTATIRVWMYNTMDQSSFGRFASYFPLSGMEPQYMWWNWDEEISWTGAGVTTAPESGSSDW
jgi:hypothetical protein